MAWKTCVLAAVLVTAAATMTAAQQITGTISGVVTDSSRGVVPGATIQVVNVGNRASRTVVTDEAGRYRVFNLTPGTYVVSAEMSGFAPVIRDNITVNINREVSVDIVLELGQLSEQVTVSGATSTVSTGSTAVVGVVTTEQIAELPLNGRNFIQLATLQPGVAVSRSTGKSFHAGYGGTNVSVAGARPEMTGYFIEGTNIADVSDKAPSSVAGVLLGVDAIQEFSVQTHGYSAEYGRAAGGVVSAITKSGTNAIRGSSFGFFRNSAMDARNYFDDGDVPPFKRSQFGGSIGGPLVRNKLFYFGAYEGLRERLARTTLARLPNQAARDGYLPDGAGGLTFVGVHPLAKPYLDALFPIPNGRDFGDGTAELAHATEDPTDEDFFVGKIDWTISGKDSALVRFSRDVSDSQSGLENPLFLADTRTNTRYLMTQHQRVFNDRLLNVLRGAVNRTARVSDTAVPLIDFPENLYYTRVPYPGGLSISGMTGVPNGSPAEYAQTIYQVNDTMTWNTSRHTMKFGFDVQRYQFDAYSYPSYGGSFGFRNLAEFLTLRRSATAAANVFTGSLPGSDTRRDITQTYVAGFAQDEFRVGDRLTLNYGLRYEFVTEAKDSEDRVAGLLSLDDLETGPKGVTPGSPMFDPPSPWLVPRLGAAWDPFGTQKTSVRAGFGIFTQPLTTSYYRGTVSRIFPYYAGVNIRQPAVFGPSVQQLLDQGTSLEVVKRSEFILWDAEQPRMTQYNLTVQHEFRGGFVAEVGYLGSRGDSLPFYGDPNSVPAEQTADGRWRVVPGAGLRYPSWGRIRTKKNVATSEYNGLTAGLTRRLGDGLLIQGSYTLGKSTDDWSAGLLGNDDFEGARGSAANWWCVECENGPSNFDVRHSFMFNGVYELPFGRGQAGLAGALAGGWQVGVLVNVASGLPFSPYIGFDRAGDRQTDSNLQRPDLAPGYAGNPIIGSPENWFDESAFVLPEAGFYGNAGRNILRGPDFRTVDLSLVKNNRIGRTSLQLRAEAFNLLNRANFGIPSSPDLFNTNGTRRVGATRITSTVSTARQIQLGVKLLF